MNSNLRTIKIAYIYNPVAGKCKGAEYIDILRKTAAGKYDLKPLKTCKGKIPEQVVTLCREGFNRIVIAGGDGTVNDVIGGVIKSGHNAVLAILPVGTGNDLAREIGSYAFFRKDPVGYIKFIANNIKSPYYSLYTVYSVNNNKKFTNYLGIGYDAGVVRNFHSKRGLPVSNRLIYIYCIFIQLLKKREGKARIWFTEKGSIKESCIAIENYVEILLLSISSYAGGMIKSDSVNSKDRGVRVILIKNLLELLLFFINGVMQGIVIKIIPRSIMPKIYTVKDSVKVNFIHKPFIQIDGEDISDKVNGNIEVRSAGQVKILSCNLKTCK